MDRRYDHRHFTDAEVSVTILGNSSQRGCGRMTDLSNNGMSVLVPIKLGAGDIVQLQIEDSTLFGFVMHSTREGDTWRAGIELQRVLIGGSHLSKVLSGALRQVMPALPGVAAG